MKKRWKEFQAEIAATETPPKNILSLTAWLLEWSAYTLKGGIRPPKPH